MLIEEDMNMGSIPENIKFLILKWKAGTITAKEKEILHTWYNEELPEELYWYGDTEESLKKRLMVNILSQTDAKVTDDLIQSRFSSRTLWAAAVAAMIIIGFFVSQYVKNQDVDSVSMLSIATTKAEITKVILPDQTIVWLKGDSKLNYPKVFNGKTRNVELVGEALFEVAKDKSKPFIIRAGDYTTRVLGTSFNMKMNPENGRLDLSVLTGTVEVTKDHRGIGKEDKYIVVANECLSTDDHKQAVENVGLLAEQQKTSITKGTEYNMNFVSIPVENIMKRFEEKFEVSFEGYSGEYKSCKVTADLTDQSLETSLKILSLAINANYKIQDNKIKLTGGGCF